MSVSRMAHRTLWNPDTSRLQLAPRVRHETPELLHFRDTLDRRAHRFGVRLDPEQLPRPLDRALIDEECPALQSSQCHLTAPPTCIHLPTSRHTGQEPRARPTENPRRKIDRRIEGDAASRYDCRATMTDARSEPAAALP